MKTIVGSEEWCAFPDLGLPAIKARVDSGAKTSSIHAFNIQSFRRDGVLWVSFEVHPIQKNRTTIIQCEKPVVDQRRVKSSSGDVEKRFVINAMLRLDKETWQIELTLTNRDSMGYRMLLGREAMVDRLMIDPDRSFCLGAVTAQQLEDYYTDTN